MRDVIVQPNGAVEALAREWAQARLGAALAKRASRAAGLDGVVPAPSAQKICP